jgi:hypothetical protein
MNVSEMISELRERRARIDEAINALRALQSDGEMHQKASESMSSDKRSGGINLVEPKRRFSVEARQRMAAAQRKRWAAVRAQNGLHAAVAST